MASLLSPIDEPSRSQRYSRVVLRSDVEVSMRMVGLARLSRLRLSGGEYVFMVLRITPNTLRYESGSATDAQLQPMI